MVVPWAIDPSWLSDLQARADAPPAQPRAPLGLLRSEAIIGSIEPRWAELLIAAGLPLRPGAHGWVVAATRGEALDKALAAIAQALRTLGPAARWRDELVAVTDGAGHPVSRIERAAARPLGIATHAVHLVGTAPDGSVWVQQRAFDKATDPGQWDTMVGGLLSAAETPRGALVRETWEEAGLRVAHLATVVSVGHVCVRRPVAEGYMVEHIDMFEAEVPGPQGPVNQDGEVAAFELLTPTQLWQRLRDGAFTLEATLILLHWLQHRGHAVEVQGRAAGAGEGVGGVP